MRLVIYDANPGAGLGNKGLRLSWSLWAWKQMQNKECDAVLPAQSWKHAIEWASQFQDITWIQYWGHGSIGAVYCNEETLKPPDLRVLAGRLRQDAYIWFRSCDTFNALWGKQFAAAVQSFTGVKVAGHTRIIGLIQPGLQILNLGAVANWEDSTGRSLWCFQSKLPEMKT